ncbi:MAG TPA: xanthine dehydrogenase family protein subunit M [Candidatus Udaeobacter sp.]|nr:xanthine dehydrogenase family protein subunit M [Candidatus Udaeobacter sp.]
MRFELQQPNSIDEAASLLAARGEDARVIAGGQSLLLMIRAGLLRPRVLISLGLLNTLTAIEALPDGGVHIGALATHRQILDSPLLRQKCGALVDAVSRIGSTPVRNFGTIGGNLCHNEMGSDPPTALLTLNAEVECLSARGVRKMPLHDFLTGYFETRLAPDEILTAIEIPSAPAKSRAAYLKYANRAGDLAIVGTAALLDMQDGFCREACIALGGVGPVPFRATEAEQLLRGEILNDQLIGEAAAAAMDMADPLSDAHASADYRRKMVRVFVVRAIQQAMAEEKG